MLALGSIAVAVQPVEGRSPQKPLPRGQVKNRKQGIPLGAGRGDGGGTDLLEVRHVPEGVHAGSAFSASSASYSGSHRASQGSPAGQRKAEARW